MKKGELKATAEGFNEMPARAVIEELLGKIKHGMRLVDTDKEYWANAEDTLVLEIDGDELYRFGGKVISETMVAVNNFINLTRPDEVHTITKGAKVVYRMWWD